MASFRVQAYISGEAVYGEVIYGVHLYGGEPEWTPEEFFTASAVLFDTIDGALTADAWIEETFEGSLTADAVIQREASGSFTAFAWVEGTGVSGFTADATVFATISGSLTTDAVLLASYSASLMADAVTQQTQVASFDLSAVLFGERTGSTTADAILSASGSGSLTTDAILLATATGQVDAEAVLKGTQSGAVAVAAVLIAERVGDFDLDAVLLRQFVQSFAVEAVTLRGQEASFTADAVITQNVGDFTADATLIWWGPWSEVYENSVYATIEASFVADAVKQDTFAGSLTADALILATDEGSLTADAIVLATIAGFFTADAIPLATIAGSATLDAVIIASVEGSFQVAAIKFDDVPGTDGAFSIDVVILRGQEDGTDLDAVLLDTNSASFAVDAVVQRSTTQEFTVDAVLLRATEGSLTADAVIFRTQTGSLFSDAVIFRTQSDQTLADAVLQEEQVSSLTVDALLTKTQAVQFAANAVLFGTEVGDLALDAVVVRTQAGALTADALVLASVPGAYTLDAVIFGAVPGSLTADAIRLHLGPWSETNENDVSDESFTLDAVLGTTYSASLTVDAIVGIEQAASLSASAVLLATLSASLSADAVVFAGQTGQFSADAVVRRTGLGSLTGDAVLQSTTEQQFTCDAVLVRLQTDAFTADAVLFEVSEGGLALDAVKADTIEGAFTADAAIFRAQGASFTLDAILLEAEPTPDGSFTADSIVTATGAASFSADAVLWATISASLTVDAVIVFGGVGGITVDAVLQADVTGDVTADAVVQRTQAGSFTADAYFFRVFTFTAGAVVEAEQTGSTTVDAFVWVPGQFSVSAYIGTNVEDVFWARAWIVNPQFGSTTLDAALVDGFLAEALVLADVTGGVAADAFVTDGASGGFGLDAVIDDVIGSFTADAVIWPDIDKVGHTPIDAVIGDSFSASLTVEAAIVLKGFTVDAIIGTVVSQSATFLARAYLQLPVTTVEVGPVGVDAYIDSYWSEHTFTIDAAYVDPTREGTFTVAADLAGEGEERAVLALDAVMTWNVLDVFVVSAEIAENAPIPLAAFIVPYFSLDAWVDDPVTASTTVDAWLARETIDAVIEAPVEGSMSLDAMVTMGSVVADAVIYGTRQADIEVLAEIVGGKTQTLTLDAVIGPLTTIDAFIQPYFTAGAYIEGTKYVIYPPGSGDPTDPVGDPPPITREFEVSIRWSRPNANQWTDITEHVMWARTRFTQSARVGPGTFELALLDSHPEFIGGEEIIVEIDDLRVWGGFVHNVDHGYVFEDEHNNPMVTLTGTDFNAVLDRRVVWNTQTPAAGDQYYKPFPPFAQGTMDRTIITTIADLYMSDPAKDGYDFKTFVDAIETPAPVTKWAMQTGTTLRQILAEIVRITEGVFWVDPYKNLHYHDRSVVTAPYPITDGDSGISCRGLSIKSSMSVVQNDVFAWGTQAYLDTGDSDIIFSRATATKEWDAEYWQDRIDRAQAKIDKIQQTPVAQRTVKQKTRLSALQKAKAVYQGRLDKAEADETEGSVERLGRWQYGEFRQDIYHQNYLDRRTRAIMQRYSEPVVTGTATIFDPGYQAGMVAEIVSTRHDVAEDLVIREMTISFPVAKEPVSGKYFAVPRYDVTLGLDPEDPWNIYEFLPFPDGEYEPDGDWVEPEGDGDDEGPTEEPLDTFQTRIAWPDNSSGNYSPNRTDISGAGLGYATSDRTNDDTPAGTELRPWAHRVMWDDFRNRRVSSGRIGRPSYYRGGHDRYGFRNHNNSLLDTTGIDRSDMQRRMPDSGDIGSTDYRRPSWDGLFDLGRVQEIPTPVTHGVEDGMLFVNHDGTTDRVDGSPDYKRFGVRFDMQDFRIPTTYNDDKSQWDVPWGNGLFDMLLKFRVSALSDGKDPYGAGGFGMQPEFGESGWFVNLGTNDYMITGLAIYNDMGQNWNDDEVGLPPFDPTRPQFYPLPIVPGRWYYVRYQRIAQVYNQDGDNWPDEIDQDPFYGSLIRGKIWDADEIEPGWQIGYGDGTAPYEYDDTEDDYEFDQYDRYGIMFGGNFGTHAQRLEIDFMSFAGPHWTGGRGERR